MSNYTLPDAQDHVFTSKFPIKNSLISQCIDGRYNQEDNQACSIPGADGGQLKVMIAVTKKLLGKSELDMTIMKKLVHILTDVVGGVKHLAFHTDTHALHDHGIGCGHLRLGNNKPDDYGVTRTELDFVIDFMNQSVAQGAINVILDGDHGERGVFIIDSATHSIHNKNAEGYQVFIFHKTCTENRNALIAEKMIKSGLIDKKELLEVKDLLNQIMEEHLNVTSGKLAKGFPIFLVQIDENGENISEIGVVA